VRSRIGSADTVTLSIRWRTAAAGSDVHPDTWFNVSIGIDWQTVSATLTPPAGATV
jgi:hypothetical protein